jgi:hypothetical protein
MAEVITETILPGTYIEVRAEGLLSVGAIATGNIGILGTAEKGSGRIQTLSSFDEGRALFGEMGTWDPEAEEDNLTLVRALRLLFDNGASTVYARRVFDEKVAKSATYQLLNESNAPILSLKAKTPGSWGNRLQIRIEEADAPALVSNEQIARSNGTIALSASNITQPETVNGEQPSIGSVTVRDQGLLHRYQLKLAPATGEVVQVNPTNRALTFSVAPSVTAEIYANYSVPKESLRRVTLRYGNVQEVYIVPSFVYLAQLLGDQSNPSRLVEVVEDKVGSGLPRATTGFIPFKGGENGTVSSADFQDALEELVNQNVQIVVVCRKFSDIKAALSGHVEKTENLGRERIAVAGSDSSEVAKILENANEVADKRVILVAPGLLQQDLQTGRMIKLPPYFAAVAVAGKLSSLAPHISLTNKTLAGIEGLANKADDNPYNYGDLKSLVQNRVLVLEKKRGIRVVKGITTHDEAFKQITLRRIVDYVKEGTRIGANQYIGKLNNRRVRENLRTTLDNFLSDLIVREFLTGYKLNVFADRAMEIRGEVLVTMDLNPTFSIDVIRVVMNLS